MLKANRRVVITGMGIVSSIGKNIDEFSKALQAGLSGISMLDIFTEDNISVKIGAQIKDLSVNDILNRYTTIPNYVKKSILNITNRSSTLIQSSVLSTLEAWISARMDKAPFSSDRLSLIVAGSNFNQYNQYKLYHNFVNNPEYLSPTYALSYMDTNQVGILSEIFQINGEGFTVGGASASGNVGIIKGVQLIQLGLADVCLVVGPMAGLSPMELQGFYNIGAMGGKKFSEEPSRACRPFDRDHEGFIYGQSSGCIVLEARECAVEREIPILGEILGGSMVLDGNRLTNPSQEGESRAMLLALAQAGLEPNDIAYLNSHGSSSPLGDEVEILSILDVFKKNIKNLHINSTKGLTGHCLNTAGIVEAIATIIQMREGFIHPNVNLENPITDECCFSGSTYLKANINVAMSNSFGFGGVNSSIVIKKGDD